MSDMLCDVNLSVFEPQVRRDDLDLITHQIETLTPEHQVSDGTNEKTKDIHTGIVPLIK